MKSEKYQKGMKVRREVLGDKYVDRALSSANEFTRPLQELVTENCWGQVWAEGVLTRSTRSLVPEPVI